MSVKKFKNNHVSKKKCFSVQKVIMDGFYVKKSGIKGAGGGLFTSIFIKKGTKIGEYAGIRVSKTALMDPNYVRGYLMDNRSHYIDARDPLGRLVMNDGRVVNPHDQTDEWWSKLKGKGVRWKGATNLMRFVNSADRTHQKNNLVIKKGTEKRCFVTSRDVEPGEEFFISYGKSFWKSPNDDFCWNCEKSGFLIECDSCNRSWHLKCCGLNEKRNLPSGKWYCPICVKKKKLKYTK